MLSLLFSALLAGQTIHQENLGPSQASTALSERIANYRIEVRLDPLGVLVAKDLLNSLMDQPVDLLGGVLIFEDEFEQVFEAPVAGESQSLT